MVEYPMVRPAMRATRHRAGMNNTRKIRYRIQNPVATPERRLPPVFLPAADALAEGVFPWPGDWFCCMSLTPQSIGDAHHFVRRLQRPRAQLVRPLHVDELREFRREVDVGPFQPARQD